MAELRKLKTTHFFKNVKWKLIGSERPPIMPDIKGPMDTSNFKLNKELTRKEVAEELSEIDVKDLKADHPFKNFGNVDYISKDDTEKKEPEKKEPEKKEQEKKEPEKKEQEKKKKSLI